MDQERKTRNEKIKKMIADFDHKFSMMSEIDQKNFATSWIEGLRDGGDKPI